MTSQAGLEVISEERAEEILEEFEAPTRKFKGVMGPVVTALAVITSLFAMYGAFGTVMTLVTRLVHVMLILMLTFLVYPAARKWKNRGLAWIPTEADVSNKILSKVIILGHPAWEEVSQLQNL
jgi:TRAP-type uncharacterized transport system fused permease subunit